LKFAILGKNSALRKRRSPGICLENIDIASS